MKILTKPCHVCGKQSQMEVNDLRYEMWLRGALIQTAFPDMPLDQRELLISGKHPDCCIALRF